MVTHVSRKTDVVLPYLYSVLFGVVGFLLAVAFLHLLGAPNFALGIVIAVTAVCYLYGLGPAVISFLLSVAGVSIWLIEPSGVFWTRTVSDWMRLVTVVLTTSVTCGLVLLLRSAQHSLQGQNLQIQEQSEELQTQNEELQAMNEELQSMTEELRETQEQLVEALRHETQIAQTLQKAFLSVVPDKIGDYVVAAAYHAGSDEAQIGGDFYDIYELADGRLTLAIGDASGKGLHAARQAVAAKYGLRFCASECDSPAICLRRLNDLLTRDHDFSGFVTLFYGILDPAEQMLTYCTGGHEPPMIYRERTGEIIRLKSTGRFVGILPGGVFTEEKIRLESGDRLFLFTDGLSEARDKVDFLGFKGLAEVLAEHAVDNDTSVTLRNVIEKAKDYAGGRLKDDAAAVLLCVN
jgi:serine phosphatase RsbU (regulator of sigma subunit)